MSRASEVHTLVELLELRAQKSAARGFAFLSDGQHVAKRFSYSALHVRAMAIAAFLRTRAEPGERAVLLYPASLDFVEAFFGCLYAGIIAVPCYPPRRNSYDSRLHAVIQDSGATLALTTESIRAECALKSADFPNFAKIEWVATDAIQDELSSQWSDPHVSADSIAFLQYTSGSTSTPKGVMVSHDNLLWTLEDLHRGAEHDDESVMVTWLPTFHDMGLIYGMLQPVYNGFQCYMMAPITFLQSPVEWLRAISNFKGSHSAAPNFAFDLCSRKVSNIDINELQLQSWKMVINGAEPVREETLRRFCERFAPCGFNPAAICPGFGLAETTLKVSTAPLKHIFPTLNVNTDDLAKNRIKLQPDSDNSETLVSCGWTDIEAEIAIVDPDTLTRTGHVGEIWVKSPSVAQGYWQRPEQTEQTFRAKIADTGEGPYLRTGDLGFVHERNLYVTGRLKDLIIIRGLNYYPQDLEQTAERSHDTLRPGCSAAFSVDVAGEERLVLVQEVERVSRHSLDAPHVAECVRRAVAEQHDIPVYAVVLIRTASIPKTSSGKIQRQLTRARYLAKELNVIHESLLESTVSSPSPAAVPAKLSHNEERLAEIWRGLFGNHVIGPDSHFFALGGDSITAVQCAAEARRQGLNLCSEDIYQAPVLCELAQLAEKKGAQAVASSTKQFELLPLDIRETLDSKIEDAFPLAMLQEMMLYQGELEPGAYHDIVSLRVEESLHELEFTLAAREIIARHPTLRTGFELAKFSSPLQCVHVSAEPYVEFRALHGDAAICDRELAGFIASLRDMRFDLRTPPLIRFLVCTRPDATSQLVISAHHAILDGWSVSLLVRELLDIYSALSERREVPHPANQSSFRDFIAAEQIALKDTASRGFWNDWLDQCEYSQFPPLTSSNASASAKMCSLETSLPSYFAGGLSDFARTHGHTLKQILTAVHLRVLSFISGNTNPVTGVVSHGRLETPGGTRVLGLFLNTIPYHAELRGGSWKQLIRDVNEIERTLAPHRRFPMAELGKTRRLFDTYINFTNFTGAWNSSAPKITEFKIHEYTNIALGVTFDLDAAGQLGLTLAYDANRITDNRAFAYSLYYQRALELLLKDPASDYCQFDLLPTDERARILSWAGHGVRGSGDFPGIIEKVEWHARHSPQKCAIEHGNRAMTYADLGAESDKLAARLRLGGAGAETLVALKLDRSIEAIVALIAIQKCRAAFLPLDPALPSARLSFILEDAKPAIMLSSQMLADGNVLSVEVLRANDGTDRISGTNRLAYVIYTSGSTGTPKGVMVPQRALESFVHAAIALYNFTDHDRVLQFATLSFDAAIEEIFPCLATGGTLVLRDDDMLGDPAAFLEACARLRIGVLDLPTAYWHQIVARLSDQIILPESVRLVIIGGEAAHPSAIAAWHARGIRARLVNTYGPTETTVIATAQDLKLEDPLRGERSIGRPIANARVYVLDSFGQPCPPEVPGELCIGGDCLSLGYLNRPELTRERFIDDPFSGISGSRLYKTGDRVAFSTSGELQFLGRTDHQLKIRGFRVELGEIESILQTAPGIQSAVVTSRSHPNAEIRLDAYVVAKSCGLIDIRSLRGYLAEKLPDYMVPATFTVLECLPLTSSGKIDRKALPVPSDEVEKTFEIVAPRNATEEVLAGLWRKLLGREQIGVHDHFFEIGGHSLLATQLAARVRDTFGIHLPLRVLFEAPTLEALASWLDSTRGPNSVPILLTQAEHRNQLSFAQERMWFIQQLDPADISYNIPLALTLTGHLELSRLLCSFERVMQRHETLRTCFVEHDGRAQSHIFNQSELKFHIDERDLSMLPESEQKKEVHREAAQEAVRPFNLAQAPLIRAKLLKLNSDNHVMLLTLHHIISDLWSVWVLVHELAVTYSQSDTSGVLPNLDIQYADFAGWQRASLAGGVLNEPLEYWKKALAGTPELLELPLERTSRPPVQTHRGAILRFKIPAGTTARLKQLSLHYGATLFMTLEAAFAVLLSRYSRQNDILIGTPAANRTRKELEPLIGFFVNTLVLRNDLNGDPRFSEFLSRVRKTALDAYANQDVPFEQIVEALHPKRNLSYNPIFQVMFAFQNAPQTDIRARDLTIAPLEIERHSAKFDLTLEIDEAPDGLNAAFEFNTDLFSRNFIERMSGHFIRLTNAIVENAEQKISALELLTVQELKQFEKWNATDLELVTGAASPTIHEMFRAQAARTPDAPALAFEHTMLSYRELDRRTNQLAAYLRNLNCGPESVVGVCMERSIEMVVALHGIVKAGAAYLPLDPLYPPERLGYMLADSKAPVLLTQRKFAGLLAHTGAQIISIDAEWPNIAKQSAESFDSGVHGDSLAYVIYTSGSTGLPKAAMNVHRAIYNRLAWMQHEYPLVGSDTVLQKTPYSFDVSVWEFFWPLMYGAKLAMARPEGHHDPLYLADAIKHHNVTTMHFVPSMLRAFLGAGNDVLARCESLRRVFSSGEALPSDLASEFLTQLQTCELHNLYGPTEAAVDVTFWPCSSRDSASSESASVPIGRPIAHTQMHVLDTQFQRVPVGVSGELYIGGISLARGYRFRPDLTAEKFIPDPFSATPGGRMYRTGDLARWRTDGAIEYLGRTDNQVKIRGFRIELGEIESVLSAHESIREAAVLALEDRPGHKRLVAYVAPRAGNEINVDDLRTFLKSRLPEYMVPAAFVTRPTLPLSPNGKLDRKALPAPGASQSRDGTITQPQSENEKVLAQIWREILGLKEVGIHANFFELGGDSIQSIQVISRAHKTGLRLTPDQLFKHQTIAELALVAGRAEIACAEQGNLEGRVPLTPIQRRFFEQNHREPNHYNQAVLLKLASNTNPAHLRQALGAVCQRHDSLRLRFRLENGEWTQEYGSGNTAQFHVHDLSNLNPGDQCEFVQKMSARLQTTLNIQSGPLTQMAFFDLGADQPGRLLWIIHHLAVDGVSWRILLEDFRAGYESAAQGVEIEYGAKTASYRQWANQQTAETAQAAAEINFWTSEQYRAAAPIEPAGRNVFHEFENSRVSASLDADLTRALLRDVATVYHTQINDVLLAALALAFTKWNGGTELFLDIEGHGREGSLDLSSTTGWFTSIYPVVLRPSADNDPGRTLKAIKEQLRAIPGHGAGYGILRYQNSGHALQLSTLPRADIAFNYLGQLDQSFTGGTFIGMAAESCGPLHSPECVRPYLIEVDAALLNGRLSTEWTYSGRWKTAAEMQSFADAYIQALGRIIRHCQSPEAGGFTPSDFAALDVSQSELDGILEELDSL